VVPSRQVQKQGLQRALERALEQLEQLEQVQYR
jgi:hypothetical protein